jgi:hypothetical protein
MNSPIPFHAYSFQAVLECDWAKFSLDLDALGHVYKQVQKKKIVLSAYLMNASQDAWSDAIIALQDPQWCQNWLAELSLKKMPLASASQFKKYASRLCLQAKKP